MGRRAETEISGEMPCLVGERLKVCSGGTEVTMELPCVNGHDMTHTTAGVGVQRSWRIVGMGTGSAGRSGFLQCESDKGVRLLGCVGGAECHMAPQQSPRERLRSSGSGGRDTYGARSQPQ